MCCRGRMRSAPASLRGTLPLLSLVVALAPLACGGVVADAEPPEGTASAPPPERAPAVVAAPGSATTTATPRWCAGRASAFCADFEDASPFDAFESGACAGSLESFGLVPGSGSSHALGVRGGATGGCQPVIVRRVDTEGATRARIAFDIRFASLGDGPSVPLAVSLPGAGVRLVAAFTGDGTTWSRATDGGEADHVLAAGPPVTKGRWTRVELRMERRTERWVAQVTVGDGAGPEADLDALAGRTTDRKSVV